MTAQRLTQRKPLSRTFCSTLTCRFTVSPLCTTNLVGDETVPSTSRLSACASQVQNTCDLRVLPINYEKFAKNLEKQSHTNTKITFQIIQEYLLLHPVTFNFIRFFLKQIHPKKSPPPRATSAATLRIVELYTPRWVNVTNVAPKTANGCGGFFLSVQSYALEVQDQTMGKVWSLDFLGMLFFLRNLTQKFTVEDLFFFEKTCDTKTHADTKQTIIPRFLLTQNFQHVFSTVHTSLPQIFFIPRLRTVGNVQFLKRESGH